MSVVVVGMNGRNNKRVCGMNRCQGNLTPCSVNQLQGPLMMLYVFGAVITDCTALLFVLRLPVFTLGKPQRQ